MDAPAGGPAGPGGDPRQAGSGGDPGPAGSGSGMDGLRLALGTLTVVPVRVGGVDRATAGLAMLWAPAVGAGLGVAAGWLGWLVQVLGGGALLASALAVAAMAALTRGLHLDGLADTADGLGSAKPAPAALDIMKASDIGPFGVVTLVLVLLVQSAALAGATAGGYGIAALATAAATGRLAVCWACREGVPAARPGGLGALVAGTVARGPLAGVTAAVLVAAAAAGWLEGGPAGQVRAVLAVAVGLGAAVLLLRHAVRRLGGVTGDVLGALVETGTVTALVVLALG
jgi:adenosylcobinamide-GDP ribazoletransferase